MLTPARLAPALLTALFLTVPLHADDWPQWLGPQRDGVWREEGILDKFPAGGPKVLWRAPLGGGYAGPAVVGDRVYVTDWKPAAGAKLPDNPFARANAAGRERLLCLDATSGKVVWEHGWDTRYAVSYPAGPRTTPSVANGRVFAIGAMGDLVCVDAATGKPIWSKNFGKDYEAKLPLWGHSASPLVDGEQVICLVGGPGSVVVSFDAATGKERWKALTLDTAELGYCPPVIHTLGGKRQLIVWHPEAVSGLDPATGKTFWTHPWAIKANLTVPTPRLVGKDRLFLTAFYDGSVLLEVNADGTAVKQVWRSKGRGEQPKQTDALHSIMPTPVVQGDHVYGVCSYGELRCLTLADGQRVWSDTRATGPYKELTRWANAFIVPQGDRYFLFNEKGDLIIAKLSPAGYEEVDRAHVLDPTYPLSGKGGERKVLWSHPAFARKAMFARNDKEIIAVSLEK